MFHMTIPKSCFRMALGRVYFPDPEWRSSEEHVNASSLSVSHQVLLEWSPSHEGSTVNSAHTAYPVVRVNSIR